MAEIRGLREFQRALKELPKGVADKGVGPLNSALRKGANIWKDAAKQHAPRGGPKTGRTAKYGDLVDNISVRKDPDPRSNNATHRYSVSYGNAFWGKFVELGTEAMVTPTKSGAQREYTKTPFLRPAFDQNKQEALDAVSDELARQIRILAKRAAKL